MDSKKFLQLVEDKKKKALEKKQARLEWEEKLEEAAKATTEVKRARKKNKTKLALDSSDEPQANRKSHRGGPTKTRSISDSSEDDDFRRVGRAWKKGNGKHKRLCPSSDEIDSEHECRPVRRHRRKHKSLSHYLSDNSQDDDESERRNKKGHKSTSRVLSDDSEDYGYQRRNRRRRKRRGSVSDTSDEDEKKKFARRHNQQGTDSDSSERSKGKRKHHGRQHRKHNQRLVGEQGRNSSSSEEEVKVVSDNEFAYRFGNSMERWEPGRYRGHDNTDQTQKHMVQHSISVPEGLESEPHDMNQLNGKELTYQLLYKKHDGNGKELLH